MADQALTKEAVFNQLKQVFDPEIPINIVDLGLVYEVDIKDGTVDVQMTLTSPGCSVGPYIAQQAEWRIAEIDDVEDVQVDVVFDPPWTPERIAPLIRSSLGL